MGCHNSAEVYEEILVLEEFQVATQAKKAEDIVLENYVRFA